MSQDVRYETLYAALGLTDSIPQIWIALTLAVVIIGVGTSILLVAGTIGTSWFVRTVRKGFEASEKKQ